MAEPTPKQKAIAALLKKYPDAGHRTLAKRLHDDNPALFTSVESARKSVRDYTGNVGETSRKNCKATGRTIRAPRKPGELPPLPKSEAKPWEPVAIDCRRCLCLSDIHLPFHDPIAVEASLAYGEQFDPDTILINGDLLDCYSISRWDKDPTKPKIAHELECCKQFFAHLSARFPNAQLVFRAGNHEERLDHYLTLNAPLFFEIEGIRDVWHGPAGLIENKVKYVRDKRPIMLGNLLVLHGHEYGGGPFQSAVNPARGAFLRLLTSVLQGHGHRQSEHTERTADGRIIACLTSGALCDLRPEYARLNKWSSGFSAVTVEKNGDYRVELKRIIDGKVY